MDIIETIRKRNTFLTVPEVAELTQLSTKTVYRKIQRGELKAFREGVTVRLNPSVVADWLESRTY